MKALDQLGLRTQATDATKLLDRLRALSSVEDAPIGPLRDLYRAFERVIPRLPADREEEVVNAFASEPLIRTETSWERSEFCFRENPADIPGVSVLHREIRDVIGLWEKLNIAAQPSLTDALRWLSSLPLDMPLSDGDRAAVRQILALYPRDSWNSEARWLTLQGRLARASDLKWSCCDPRAVPSLFSSIRGESADFSMLGGDKLSIVGLPPQLETAIDRRILSYVPGAGDAAAEESWLHALGDVLSRLQNDSDESEQEVDQRLGRRLAATAWISVEAVLVQPHLDGVPAGTESELSTAWIGDSLYVRGTSIQAYKSLLQEISRPFAGAAAITVIRDCIGRDANWIRAYADVHLDLAREFPEHNAPLEEAVQPEFLAPVSLFPEPSAKGDGITPEGPGLPQTPPDRHEGRAESEENPVPEAEAELETQRTTKPPSKLDRLEYFLAQRGFCWAPESGVFLHPDGSVVHKSDGIFPWELVASNSISPLWLSATSLSDREGIEIPAEVWNAAKRCAAILLSPEGAGFKEHHFSVLRSEVEIREVELFPATYRLRTVTDDE